MRLPTRSGCFEVQPRQDGVLITGTITYAGQGYEVQLILSETEDGWVRHDPDDLTMTKSDGANAGKPARPAARELLIASLPEAVNEFLDSDAGHEVVDDVHGWIANVLDLRTKLAEVEQERVALEQALKELGA